MNCTSIRTVTREELLYVNYVKSEPYSLNYEKVRSLILFRSNFIKKCTFLLLVRGKRYLDRFGVDEIRI